jgi:hypothetical protein
VRDRSSLLPALVAVAATATPFLASAPAAATPPPSTTVRTSAAATAPAAAEGDEPLRVTIESLTPGFVPERGPVTMTGTVTNASDERWRAINVHAFIDDAPLTSAAEVAATAETPVDAEVGTRITIPGTFDDIGSLGPGETASYSVRLKRSELPVELPGVYWFGAHALGNTTEARDTVADGRSRTLLPLVPSGSGREKAAVVVPLRHSIRHAPNGRLRSARRWARDLSVGGQLRELADLGAAAGSTPVTWLVDPALPDAVARLVAGNTARTLDDREDDPDDAPSQEPSDPESGTASSDAETVDSGDGEGTDDGTEGGGQTGPRDVAAEAGEAWLARLQAAILGDEVLTLPYGDPDVAAVAANARQFYDRAVRRGGTQLGRWRVPTSPAVAPPAGYLAPDALSLLAGDETVILSDRALEPPQVLTTGRIEGHRTLFSSADTARGGPGPGDPLAEVALRQRFLAEAAVRLLFHDRTPLLTVLPDDWTPSDPGAFWEGLDEVPWLRLTDTGSLGRATDVPRERVLYPVEQELTELDPENFTSAERLIAAGATLDNVLPETDQLAGLTLDEALTSLSYTERSRALEARRDTDASTAWLQRRLDQVRIRAPRGVTLSSASGDFFTTVTNRLDHPVTVVLSAVSLGAVEVADSDPIELAAGGRQTVSLQAESSGPGVHYVRVTVTDEEGTPLGASQRVAIRSAEVSQVIWLILGVGVGLLFVAIGIRLVRRVRSERA